MINSQDLVLRMAVWTLCSLALLGYLLLVRRLRRSRLYAVRMNVARLKQSRGHISPFEAQKVAHQALLYDMPLFSRLGAQAALFKTYGVVSYSGPSFHHKLLTLVASLLFLDCCLELES